jgi:hypothetical protein
LSATPSGGVWAGSIPAIATVSSTGAVTGVAAGTIMVSYSIGGCVATRVITVTAGPAPIVGSSSLCIGASTTLTDAVAGGTWTSGTPSVATVGMSTGVVTGVSAGVVMISYTVGACTTTKKINVSACSGSLDGEITGGEGKGTASGVPVTGMLVSLKDATDNSTVAQAYTDASGLYSFTGIADGAYYIYPEKAGYTTTPSSTFPIGASVHLTHVNFRVHEGSKTIIPGPTDIDQLPGSIAINIAPNPTSGHLNIGWEGQVIGNATVTITDLAGRTLNQSVINSTATAGVVQIDLSGLKDGIYLVQIRSAGVNYNSQILIRH